MSQASSIEWTDATWNPVRGCSRVSPGCEKCYAERVAGRFSGPGMPYHGLAVMGEHGPRWTRKVRMVPEHLADPLRWSRPRRIFVNSMSDLFHEELSNEDIASVFGVMAAAPQHTFQILTKRAQRMRDWFRWAKDYALPLQLALHHAQNRCEHPALRRDTDRIICQPWPLRNVWLGVSAEDQQRADERIPNLLETPAAVRFVSYEPAVGHVDFGKYIVAARPRVDMRELVPPLDQIIVGGESGPGARPFKLNWARSVVEQCRYAKVACFVKQMGTNALDAYGQRVKFANKGGNMSEWPEELRVREFPGGRP
jgi:protein gp37